MRRLLVLLILLVFVAPVQAKNKKNKKHDYEPAKTVEKPFGFLPPPPPLPGMTREKQQDIIERYYRNNQRQRDQYRHYDDDRYGDYSPKKGKKKKHLPPGLQKKAARGKALPPGWQKKIARGQVLDHDLREHCRELPDELLRDLPLPPRGTKFLRLEDKIIRVVENTFEIIDIFNVGR